MFLVVDTNITFSFFNERSEARNLSMFSDLELCSPFFVLEEINEHKQEILEKFSLSEEKFLSINNLLKSVVKFIEEEEYSEFLAIAKNVSLDPDDVDIFALALKFKCGIWSNDKQLKQQSRVKVFSTKELIKILYSGLML